MDKKYALLAAAVMAVGVVNGNCQPVITSLQGNGQITWIDPNYQSNALYRIEWAAGLTNIWRRDWSGLEYLQMGTNSGATVAPMIFRVVRETNTTAIVGSWGGGCESLNWFRTLTFYPDGHYIHWETKGPGQPSKEGVEIGTYVYDATQHTLEAKSSRDDNGDLGLTTSAPQTNRQSVYVMGDVLVIDVPGKDRVFLNRVQNSSAPIVGGWGDGRNGDHSGYVTITLYPNGYYIHWQTADPTPDTKEGVEYGIYSYDPATKYLTTVALRDDNGTMGLCGDPSAAIVGGRYRFQVTVTNDVLVEFGAARVK